MFLEVALFRANEEFDFLEVIMKAKWYVATLIMLCKVTNEMSELFTCDEQIRLIRATDSEQAYEKALRFGKDEEHSYMNSDGNEVFWEFIGLEDLEELFDETIRDGREIRSRISNQLRPFDRIRVKEDLTVFLSNRSRQG
jgi:hypothetical protein